MPAFLVRSGLSREDLTLFLRNQEGYSQDAYSVHWTVFSDSGRQVSGRRLPAIRVDAGRYYAPWLADVANGNYRVDWDVWETACSEPRLFTQQFYVIDPSSYSSSGPINQSAVPVAGKGTYLTGSVLGRGDIPLFLRGEDGLPANAFAVFWTVFNSFGNAMTPRTIAVQAAAGEYYAPWYVDVNSGDYQVRWEWMEDAASPLAATVSTFSVINPSTPYAPYVAITCDGIPVASACSAGPLVLASKVMFIPAGSGGSGASTYCPPIASVSCNVAVPSVPILPMNGNCSIEIPRVIHISEQILPPSCNFTGQAQYIIPRGVRRLTYYVTYRRGAPGGYATIRLLWGNGVEETHSTIIDSGLTVLSTALASQDMFLYDLTGPMPSDDSPVTFSLEVAIPGGASTTRLLVAERGVPGIPGTISVTLTASS